MKRRNFEFTMVIVVIVLMSACLSLPLFSVGPMTEDEILQAVRIQAKPRIDGVLDDEAWQIPPLEKDFITYYPVYGEKLPYATRVWITYDNKNLYFAFDCSDPEPSKIKTSITKRDNMFGDDWVAVGIDAVGNGQTSIILSVNPSGIQGDALCAAGKLEDTSPDFVWESAAKITDKGYQVEICLPFSSISYTSGKEVRMGILFERKITSVGSRGSWPDIRLGNNILDSQTKAIYKNIKKQLRLETLPSLTHSSDQLKINPDEWGDRDSRTEFGIDFKYGITSSITANVTVNPDFSQVESDAFQVEVNQRYPLFFSEKRHFFMEGADMFSFYTFLFGFLTTPVHTRRIVDPGWGAKVTGNAGKLSFGVLSAGDEWPGQKWEGEVNPDEGKQALFGIARGKYSLGKNNYIGFLYSGREFADGYNQVMGSDFVYRIGRNQRISASFLNSMSGDETGRIGESSQANYGSFMYNFDSKLLLLAGAFEHIGKDFRMDSSYLRRTGVNTGLLWFGIAFYPDPNKKMGWLKMISPDLRFHYTHDLFTGKDDTLLNAALYFFTLKEGVLILTTRRIKENWQGIEFNLTQYAVEGKILLTNWMRISGNYQYGDSIYYEGEPPFQGKGQSAGLILNLQPNKNLNQYFGYTYSELKNAGQDIYNVNIYYSKTTYQFNKYFFMRAVIQYDSYEKRFLTDLLGSFTLIPGTVLHIGYGGLYEKRGWENNDWVYRTGDMLNVKRSFFAKISYLWRL